MMEQRPEIEAVVARAMDVHRGRHSQDLLWAALLLCDWPQSKTLAILQTTKHGGQSAMVRRLQQPPEAEHVEAFLLGATHGQLRLHFGNVFSHIEEVAGAGRAAAKDALAERPATCNFACTRFRGAWVAGGRPAARHRPARAADACRIGDWLGASGMHDLMQDERLTILAQHAKSDLGGRLRLMRMAMRRKKNDRRAVPAIHAGRRRRAADAPGGAGDRASASGGF